MITRENVLAALERVMGPDGKTPLSRSEILQGVSVRDGKVFASILADPKNPSAMENVRSGAEKAIKALKGISGVFITLTAERLESGGPKANGGHGHAHAHDRGQAIRQGQTQSAGPAEPVKRPAGNPIPGVNHIIAVASGKGGVGKSTTAANLAVGLAALGLKIGVLDADIYGPSMPRLFGIKTKPEVVDGNLVPIVSHGVKVISIGLLVGEDTPMVWRGPMVMSALTQLLREVDWAPLDVLVVDMPPGTGDAQLTMAQNVPLSGAVIVSTPQDLALLDARRGVSMFERVHVPILGVVENMSYFICPKCGERSEIFAHGGARKEAEKLNVPFLGEVPLDMEIRELSDSGRPVVAAAPQSAHAQAYMAIARAVAQTLEPGGASSRKGPAFVVEK